MALAFALSNQSSLVTDKDALRIAHTSQLQLRDLCADWDRHPATVTLLPHSRSSLKAGKAMVRAALARHYIVLVLKDELEVPDALGDHSVDEGGWPVGEIGCRVTLDGGGDVFGPDGILSVVTHEFDETELDPYIGEWDDMAFDDQGEATMQMAHESADPVQANCYGIGGLYVSNYVRPPYFDAYAIGTGDATFGVFDRMGVLTAPFSLAPGGYAMTRARGADGTWSTTPIFGKSVTDAQRTQILSKARVRMRCAPNPFVRALPAPS